MGGKEKPFGLGGCVIVLLLLLLLMTSGPGFTAEAVSGATSCDCEGNCRRETLEAVQSIGCKVGKMHDPRCNDTSSGCAAQYGIKCVHALPSALTKISELDIAACLTEVVIESGNITYGKQQLAGMTRLEELALRHVRLKKLDPTYFSSLPNLLVLDLSDNFLESVPNLEGLEKVIELNLLGNNIKQLEGSPFHAAISLARLVLENNNLRKLSRQNCRGLGILRFAYLRLNRLRNVPQQCLKETPDLRFLDLSDNPLQAVSRHPFSGARNLTSLLLARCRLSSLEPGTFSDLDHLTLLVLDGNFLHSVPRPTLCELPRLQILELRNNRLEVIGSHEFGCLRKVKVLRLGTNRLLSSIKPCAFSNLSSLQNLDISDSNLTFIDPEAFKCGEEWTLHQLKLVQLRENALETLDVSSLRWNSLTVTLDGNPWKCDCRVAWMRAKLGLSTLKQARCASPPRLAGQSLITTGSQLPCTQNSSGTSTHPRQDVAENVRPEVSLVAIWGPFVVFSLVAISGIVGCLLSKWRVERMKYEFTRLEELS